MFLGSVAEMDISVQYSGKLVLCKISFQGECKNSGNSQWMEHFVKST